MVNWDEATPFSRILAIVVFVGLIPSLSFYLGTVYQDTRETASVMRVYDFPRLDRFTAAAAATQMATESATSSR